MTRLAVALFAALVSWLGLAAPSSVAAVPSPTTAVGYIHEAPHRDSSATYAALERGPPASTASRVTTYNAVGLRSHGALARPSDSTILVTYHYDGTPRPVQSDNISQMHGGDATGPLSLPTSSGVAANGGGDAARFVTGSNRVTTDLLAPSGKLPFPKDLVPSGMTPNAYGNSVWGVGPEGAKSLIGARSASQLEGLGLTISRAQRWQDFYLNVATLNPRNAAAAARVDLMQDVINTLGGPR